jgi:hypothetical protein
MHPGSVFVSLLSWALTIAVLPTPWFMSPSFWTDGSGTFQGSIVFGLLGFAPVLNPIIGSSSNADTIGPFTSYSSAFAQVCQTGTTLNGCSALQSAAAGGTAAFVFFILAALCHLVALIFEFVLCCYCCPECTASCTLAYVANFFGILRIVSFAFTLLATIVGGVVIGNLTPSSRFVSAGAIIAIIANFVCLLGVVLQCCCWVLPPPSERQRPAPSTYHRRMEPAAPTQPVITLQFPAIQNIKDWGQAGAEKAPPPPSLPAPAVTTAALPSGPCPYWNYVTNNGLNCSLTNSCPTPGPQPVTPYPPPPPILLFPFPSRLPQPHPPLPPPPTRTPAVYVNVGNGESAWALPPGGILLPAASQEPPRVELAPQVAAPPSEPPAPTPSAPPQ